MGHHGGQNGPAGARKARINSQGSVRCKTRKSQGIISPGHARILAPVSRKKAGIVTSRPSPFGAGYSKKIRSRGLQEFGTYWLLLSLEFFARPPALVVWRGRLWPAAAGSSRSAARSRDRCAVCARRQAPPRSPGTSWSPLPAVHASSRRDRRDRRDRRERHDRRNRLARPRPGRPHVGHWGRASHDCRDRRADLP
jgi:hypothetical protein